jgi:hypothetical protein
LSTSGIRLFILFVATSLSAPAPAQTVFPDADYTPHGYLDNPYHTMIFNRSGILRSYPPLGFGFWKTDFKGSYGGAPRDHQNYVAILHLAALIEDTLFADTSAFAARGVSLSSRHHSKNMMSYDWSYRSVDCSAKYFQIDENSLGCLVTLVNRAAYPRHVTIHATGIYGTGGVAWWGRDGISSAYADTLNGTVQKVWAYGDMFVLGADAAPSSHKATPSMTLWRQWMQTRDRTSRARASLRGRGPMYSLQSYDVTLTANAEESLLLVLSRGTNEADATAEFRSALRMGKRTLAERLDDDERFWSSCPTLTGDWPVAWKHGWVYDFETLRMNVRPPVGIFKHPWDAMQVHSPRVVLGETCMDMMTLSYADPDLAKEVIYGTFADAIAPNVPCAREDGSVNMISSDGSECGTAPMWGYPFHVIRSIYRATNDRAWIARLYPHLKSYLEWWLAYRTDSQGWLHCNNSWESGQDGSRRFLVAEGNEGAVADFVRTVDVEASMAEAMLTMIELAPVAGREADTVAWRTLADVRIDHVRQMFFDGWYRDVDARTGKPIILDDYHDMMMLAPLACGVASAEHIAAVRPTLPSFTGTGSLQWPPGMFTFAEAAWNAGERALASSVIAATADRVYRRTDSHHLQFVDSMFEYRIPGVANEFWPDAEIPPGGENYGWGATLPMNIVRSIIGLRESPRGADREWILSPSLPGEIMHEGVSLGVERLQYRGVRFDLSYTPARGGIINVELRFPESNTVFSALNDERIVVAESRDGVLRFRVKNGGTVRIRG